VSVFPLMGTRQFMAILESHNFSNAPQVVATGRTRTCSSSWRRGLGSDGEMCTANSFKLASHVMMIRVGLGLCDGLSSGTVPASNFLSCE
jgi:hypothetical protein